MRRIDAQAVWVYRMTDGTLTSDREVRDYDNGSARVRCLSERDYRLLTRVVRAAEAERHHRDLKARLKVYEALDALNAPGKGRKEK